MSTEPNAAGEAPTVGFGGRSRFQKLIADYAVVGALVLLIIGFSIALPRLFPSLSNLQTILGDQAIPGILALAVLLPLASGEFDLSVGATLGFVSIFCAWAASNGVPVGLILVLALILGLVIGLVNALLVRIGVNAFIATLGVSTVLAGGNLFVSNGTVIYQNIASSYTELAQFKVGGIALPVFYFLVLALIVWYLLDHTPYGRYVRATGLGRESARLTGIRTKAVLSSAFVVAAVIAALAGFLQTARVGSAPPDLGPTFLLPAYAAAFLGTTTVIPGRFNVWGTVIGVYLLAVGINGLSLAGAPQWVPSVFNGGALIVAVTLAVLVDRRKHRAP